MTRSKKLTYTISSSIVNQILTIISGFVLPRLILQLFGSETNGLVVSISQFLGLISFLDMGVGQVVQSCLYAPLANQDYGKVSDIMISCRSFFRKLASLFVIYTIFLAIVYPVFTETSFEFTYVAGLILIMSVSSFAQYFFGISYQLLLNSNQLGYIYYNIQSCTIVLNLVLSAVLLYNGGGIHSVKLITALVYLLRPFLMYLYVRKYFPTVRFRGEIDYEPIEQKWNGFAQHFATVVLTNTDSIVLTMFSTLSNVSIYSVYNMVLTGVKQLFTSATQGLQPYFGELWAKKAFVEIKQKFQLFEWCIHTGTVFLFGCTGVLIIPFVKVYTQGVNDVNYIVPVFATVITMAHASHCIRIPYNMMILACGHFRQTQNCYFISAFMNIAISVLVVSRSGLVGVAVGTLAAMIYQTVWMMLYLKKNFFDYEVRQFIKLIFADMLTIIVGATICNYLSFDNINYFSWFVLAVKAAFIWLASILIIHLILYKKMLMNMVQIIEKNIVHRSSK